MSRHLLLDEYLPSFDHAIHVSPVPGTAPGQSPPPPPPTFRIRDLPARGWVLLGERPGQELVYGQVGMVWRGTGGAPDPPVTADTFTAPPNPGSRRWRRAPSSCRAAPRGSS